MDHSHLQVMSLRVVKEVVTPYPPSGEYRGTSIITNSAALGPYRRNMPRASWRPSGVGVFLMSEVPL